jgi:hypothetical protein
MKKLAAIFAVIFLSLSASSARADGIGLTVSGSLTLLPGGTTNYFDSANGAVPAGYGNSTTNGNVVIGSGIEFAATNGADLFTANFTGTTLTITDTCVGAGCGTTPFFVQFYSPFITGYTIDSYSFPNSVADYGLSSTFGGNAGMFTYLGGSGFTGGTAVFDYTSVSPTSTSAVPEPGTLGLMATGLVGAAGFLRRKFLA